MTGRGSPQSGERRRLEAELDQALAQTFPASDPVAVGRFTSTEPPARPVDRQPPELMIPAPFAPAPRKGKSSN